MDFMYRERKETIDFLRVLIDNRRLIILFVVVTCIVTATVTFFIPKEYISTATVFPTDSNSLDDVLKNPQFGYDVEADRLIQLLESRTIRDSIIRKFDLAGYYGIDKNDADWNYRLKKKFDRDITFTKTVFMSVVISARTREPELSANIVNEIIRLINGMREHLLKQNVYIARDALQREYYTLKSDLDSLGTVLDNLTKNRTGVRQYVQTEKYISLIFDKNQMSDDEAGKAIQLVVNQYNVKLGWFYDVQNKLKNANLMTRRPLPSVYIIESAVPSYKKSYPRYSINLLVAFTGSLVFICFFLFFLGKVRMLWKQIKEV
jgi:uncharacterized protein involved in exopolysaccharide biosynthesis